MVNVLVLLVLMMDITNNVKITVITHVDFIVLAQTITNVKKINVENIDILKTGIVKLKMVIMTTMKQFLKNVTQFAKVVVEKEYLIV